ncbi:hypothetical protein JHW43_000650 [Diplocarpon mali]|nr:hypothetical protein JHW43_000650 [Diplocarpon mali]
MTIDVPLTWHRKDWDKAFKVGGKLRCRTCFMTAKHRRMIPVDKVPRGLSDIGLIPCGCLPIDGITEELFAKRGLLRSLGKTEARYPKADNYAPLTHLGLEHRGAFMRFLEWLFGGNLQPEFLVLRRERALAMLAASDLHSAVVFDVSRLEGIDAWARFQGYRAQIESSNQRWRTTNSASTESGGCIKVDTNDC